MARNPFPSIKALTAELLDVKRGLSADDDYLDVRLQVMPGEGWSLHTGDSQYDTDHRGFWGASSLDAHSACRSVAVELIDEARDHAAQCAD